MSTKQTFRYPGIREAMDGNTAVIMCERESTDAAGAYPITPSTQMGEYWAEESAKGHINISGRDVAIWRPAGSAPASGFPVVLFSHGFGGCNTQSVFLMEALARSGYFVLAPNHKDAHCGSAKQESRQS